MNIAEHNATTETPNRGVFKFFFELGRRKVYRAATAYAVVLWLVYQVVELVAPELGLPDWTLRFVILVGILGFPITLVLSWLLEVTPQGIVFDGEDQTARLAAAERAPTRRVDRAIDCSLMLVALLISAQLVINALSTATASAVVDAQKIVVTPFRIAGDDRSAEWSEGLMIELQHELASQTDLIVIAPRDPYEAEDSVIMIGAVSLTNELAHVTVALIDTDTDVVAWSQTIECSADDSLRTPVRIARRIVAALPMVNDDADLMVADNASQ